MLSYEIGDGMREVVAREGEFLRSHDEGFDGPFIGVYFGLAAVDLVFICVCGDDSD
jgi:hypothetical protein